MQPKVSEGKSMSLEEVKEAVKLQIEYLNAHG